MLHANMCYLLWQMSKRVRLGEDGAASSPGRLQEVVKSGEHPSYFNATIVDNADMFRMLLLFMEERDMRLLRASSRGPRDAFIDMNISYASTMRVGTSYPKAYYLSSIRASTLKIDKVPKVRLNKLLSDVVENLEITCGGNYDTQWQEAALDFAKRLPRLKSLEMTTPMTVFPDPALVSRLKVSHILGICGHG